MPSDDAVARGALSRRALVALGLAAPWAARMAWADESVARRREPDTLRRQRRAAIRSGAAWIAKQQVRRQGAFGNNNGIVALTSLSVLALMAEGSTDGRGRYGKHIAAGLDFLTDLVLDPKHGGDYADGYFYHPQDDSSKMHGQGFATLALATALGTTNDRRYRRIRGVLEKAVTCIENAQARTGGFGYEPSPGNDHEGSVTVTVAQGLRAARDAGLRVNETVVKKGLHYLKRSQNPDGSFRYSLSTDKSSYALTAAAISSFFLYGRYVDDRERTIQRGMDFMMRQLRAVRVQQRWYYYGNFYAAWACWQKDGGDWSRASRTYWARWQREMIPDILGKQSTKGWWEDQVDQFEFGRLLPTTFAVLTLAVPDEPLPVFQR